MNFAKQAHSWEADSRSAGQEIPALALFFSQTQIVLFCKKQLGASTRTTELGVFLNDSGPTCLHTLTQCKPMYTRGQIMH
jgi:hypothetical protein